MQAVCRAAVQGVQQPLYGAIDGAIGLQANAQQCIQHHIVRLQGWHLQIPADARACACLLPSGQGVCAGLLGLA